MENAGLRVAFGRHSHRRTPADGRVHQTRPRWPERLLFNATGTGWSRSNAACQRTPVASWVIRSGPPRGSRRPRRAAPRAETRIIQRSRPPVPVNPIDSPGAAIAIQTATAAVIPDEYAVPGVLIQYLCPCGFSAAPGMLLRARANGRACGLSRRPCDGRLAVESSSSEADLGLLERVAVRDEAALAACTTGTAGAPTASSCVSWAARRTRKTSAGNVRPCLVARRDLRWQMGTPAAWLARIARNRAIDGCAPTAFGVTSPPARRPGRRDAPDRRSRKRTRRLRPCWRAARGPRVRTALAG